VAPCMPGAELTEVVDDKNWKGKVTVKVGPVSMSFLGTVTMQERDDAAKRVVLKADGRDSRGKGAANALVTAQMEPAGDGTKVSIDTALTITGAAAQYARGGMIQDISGRLTKEFATCLQANMQSAGAPAAAPRSQGPRRVGAGRGPHRGRRRLEMEGDPRFHARGHPPDVRRHGGAQAGGRGEPDDPDVGRGPGHARQGGRTGDRDVPPLG